MDQNHVCYLGVTAYIVSSALSWFFCEGLPIKKKGVTYLVNLLIKINVINYMNLCITCFQMFGV